jgi:hypothetical protein
VNNLVDQLKKGYSFGVSAASNPQAYRNADQAKEGFVAIAKGVQQAVAAIGPEMEKQAKLIFQSPSETLNGCVFSNHPACRQLVYWSGIEPVYTFEPPPGWGLSGIPTPIIVVVFNAATGETTFGTPLFMPCTITATKQIMCPNNLPFSPLRPIEAPPQVRVPTALMLHPYERQDGWEYTSIS